jgi:FkbM family methyltransferase
MGFMAMSIVVHEDTIFDIGFHRGLDTKFYLEKGFRVVAIEANPTLAELGRRNFAVPIEDGRLTLLNVGLAPSEGNMPFYRNLSNDEWSSFDQGLGTRQGSEHEVISVPCITPAQLFRSYGVPYYVKCDIEGFDSFVVQAISELTVKPKLFSVEDNGLDTVIALYNSGARSFKLLDQVEKWRIQLPNPALEGRYYDYFFGEFTSGPFGQEVPGDWMKIDEALLFYLNNVRVPGVGLQQNWWDIHVAY